VRARLLVLAEQPERWAATARAWRAHAAGLEPALPDGWSAYFLFQTLVGAWPLAAERARAVMQKSAREAKLATSWTRPDADYERRLDGAVERLLGDAEFQGALAAYVAPLVAAGRTNALAQTLLQLALPGVPDLYQGSELWNLRLVDPDNREPVDFELRARLLADPPENAEDALAGTELGLPKLYLIRRGLAVRRARARSFGPAGRYEPLAAAGSRREHVLAFLRGDDVLALAPRLPWKLAGDWGDTTLGVPRGRWRDALTGAEVEGGAVAVQQLLARFPVALLERAA
jgi:(1->4)-alpha-D-glucan 1-alpha-D-glucosylmutase